MAKKIYYEDEVVFKYYQFIDALSEQEFYSNMEEMRKLSFYDTGVQAEYGDQLLNSWNLPIFTLLSCT